MTTKTRYDTHFGTWDQRDYKDRVIVGVYTYELLNWLVTQDPQGIEMYPPNNRPHLAGLVQIVGVPPQLYTLMALKFG